MDSFNRMANPLYRGRLCAVQDALFRAYPYSEERPTNANHGPSLDIYHDVFASFRQAMDLDNTEFTEEDYVMAAKLMKCLTNLDEPEDTRYRNANVLLGQALGMQLSSSELSGNDSDVEQSAVLAAPLSGITSVSIPILHVMYRMSADSSGVGIEHLIAQSASQCIVDAKLSHCRNVTCCPTFLLVVKGTIMSIYGFVLVDDWIMEPLIQPIDALWGIGQQAPARHFRMTQFLAALRNHLGMLQEYYSTLEPHPKLQEEAVTPFKRFFDDGLMTLTYEKRLVQHQPSSPLFLATLQRTNDESPPASTTSTRVVVKFSTHYNEPAHRLLASHGLAPRIHYHEKLSPHSAYFIVVMDYLADFHSLNYLDHLGSFLIDQHQHRDIEQAIRLLHEHNWVFGDLRAPNILLRDSDRMDTDSEVKGRGERRAVLIDFDWCAEHEVGRYPIAINPEISWAEETRAGQLMRMEHDQEMLARLRPV